MTNRKHAASLDEVLADYTQASQAFDAKVLLAFVDKYPEHARALQRYAHIQLISAPASAEEVEKEQVTDEEMLPLQSKLLQRLQQLHSGPSVPEVDQAVSRLSEISGNDATEAATIAIFGSSAHGQDVLFLTVIESEQSVKGTPNWFYKKLGAHMNVPMPVMQAALAKRGHVAKQQRHSSRSKPVHSPPVTWAEAVEECITDEATKKAILDRTDDA